MAGRESLPSFQLPLCLCPPDRKFARNVEQSSSAPDWRAFECNQFEWQDGYLTTYWVAKFEGTFVLLQSLEETIEELLYVVWVGVLSDTVNVQTFTSERESSPWGRILRNHQIGKKKCWPRSGSRRKETEVSFEIFHCWYFSNNILQLAYSVYLYLQSTIL